MKILVINCGSSSLKYQLIDMKSEKVMAKGLVERIGIEGSILTQKIKGKDNFVIKQSMKDHEDAIKLVLNALVDEKHGVIKDMNEISAVGHRVVHGGEKYSESTLIDETVIKDLKECAKLAPLHNPPNIIGINACRNLMPNTPMVAVFDTAFHQTLPDYACMYSLPYEFYKEDGIRKYGFHGTSHKYVSAVAAEMLNKDIKNLKMITCHLGNGASITAIKNGKSIDTSMGFTPLAGIIMGTRCGNIDPAVITFLIKELKLSADEVDNIINKKSGILGISGISSDFRDVTAAAKKDNKRAKLALNMFQYRIKQYIGAYVAIMNGIDCLVFTAGIGENASLIREKICNELDYLGIKIDKEKNNVSGVNADVSSVDSKVKILVIPTNEELMIAKETLNLI